MVCTFFGHKDTPKEIEPTLRSTLIELIENKNVTVFYVGNNGNFDTMVRRQLEDLSQTYPITYSVVLAYLPTEKNKYDISLICRIKKKNDANELIYKTETGFPGGLVVKNLPANSGDERDVGRSLGWENSLE